MKKITKVKSLTDSSDELLNMYLSDIRKIPILSREEESSLCERLKCHDEKAIEKLITSNLRYVITIAKQYQGQGVELMDLISEGNSGLIFATRHFDPDKGVRFLTYATWWIKQSIIHALNMDSRTVRIPHSALIITSKIIKVIDAYLKEFHRNPSYDEIADAANIDVKIVTQVLSKRRKTLSLDTPFEKNTEDAFSLLDIVPNNEMLIDEQIIQKEKYDTLYEYVNKLPDRERVILLLYFGTYSNEMNLDEIGEKFGLTAERIRQLKDEALEWLKNNIEYE